MLTIFPHSLSQLSAVFVWWFAVLSPSGDIVFWRKTWRPRKRMLAYVVLVTTSIKPLGQSIGGENQG